MLFIVFDGSKFDSKFSDRFFGVGKGNKLIKPSGWSQVPSTHTISLLGGSAFVNFRSTIGITSIWSSRNNTSIARVGQAK
jgi:hypothetical protein